MKDSDTKGRELVSSSGCYMTMMIGPLHLDTLSRVDATLYNNTLACLTVNPQDHLQNRICFMHMVMMTTTVRCLASPYPYVAYPAPAP